MTAGTLDAAFEAALAADAGTAAPTEATPPPRVVEDSQAPFGRAADGSPIAPHGLKADGTPRLHAAGPGRPRKGADKPRVDVAPPGASVAVASPAQAGDYTEALMDLGTSAWIGASALKGGRLLGFPIPDLRPYAALWHAQLPQQVTAWNTAAKQNATVRGYVNKFSGDGSMTWLIGVAVAAAGFAAGCAEIARADADTRATLVALNDKHVAAFVNAQIQAVDVKEAAA